MFMKKNSWTGITIGSLKTKRESQFLCTVYMFIYYYVESLGYVLLSGRLHHYFHTIRELQCVFVKYEQTHALTIPCREWQTD